MKRLQIKDSVQVVAINYDNRTDLEYAKGSCGNTGFYKFPVKGIGYPKKACDYIAFYLSDDDCFGDKRRGIIYYAKIKRYEIMKKKLICAKKEFLERKPESNELDYYKLEIDKLMQLSSKIKNPFNYGLRYCYSSLKKLFKSKNISQLYLNKKENS
ncbi:MAG: hypothetical protein ABIE94_05770 [archaeon]